MCGDIQGMKTIRAVLERMSERRLQQKDFDTDNQEVA